MGRFYQLVTVGNSSNSQMVDYVNPGSATFTTPTAVTRLTFEVWGSGGGGGAKCCCECYHGGPNGGGGGYARKTITTAPGCQYAICVAPGGMVGTVGNCTLHWCCYGQAGSTSYVTGYNLSNLCATGGDGGRNDCYYFCGCSVCGGIGYGGDLNAIGGCGTIGGWSDAYFWHQGSSGGSPMGAKGSWNGGDHCCPCHLGSPGVFPGAGGTSVQSNICCCCSQGATGANGMVRIHY